MFCFLFDLLDALSGNMSGALVLVKVCKNICSSRLDDKLIVFFYDCFAFWAVVVVWRSCQIPQAHRVFFHIQWRCLFMPAVPRGLCFCSCVLHFCLTVCLYICICWWAFHLLSCLVLGLVQVVKLWGPVGLIIMAPFSWEEHLCCFKSSLVEKSNAVADVSFWQFQCCSFPVHRLSKSILVGFFCSSSWLVSMGLCLAFDADDYRPVVTAFKLWCHFLLRDSLDIISGNG